MEKERTVILEEIKMYLDMPSSHVHEILGELLWENQPLGRNIAGTHETVSGLSRKELKGFFDAHYHPTNILITACGKVNHEQFLSQIEKRFKTLRRQEISSFAPANSSQKEPKLRFLEKKTEFIRMKPVEKEPDDPFAITIDLGEKGMKQSDRIRSSPDAGDKVVW